FNGITETRPTRKGVCVNVVLLPALIAALNAAAAEAHRLGLLPQAEPDQPTVNGVARAKDRTAAERQRRRRERLRASRDNIPAVTVDESVTGPLFSESSAPQVSDQAEKPVQSKPYSYRDWRP